MKTKLTVERFVTRTTGSPDETNRVEFWPIGTDLEGCHGRWLPKDRSEKPLGVMQITEFKQIFGFTPRTGSKEILRIMRL